MHRRRAEGGDVFINNHRWDRNTYSLTSNDRLDVSTNELNIKRNSEDPDKTEWLVKSGFSLATSQKSFFFSQ